MKNIILKIKEMFQADKKKKVVVPFFEYDRKRVNVYKIDLEKKYI